MAETSPDRPTDPMVLIEQLRKAQFPHLESALVRRVLLLHLQGMQRDRDLDRAIDEAIGVPTGEDAQCSG